MTLIALNQRLLTEQTFFAKQRKNLAIKEQEFSQNIKKVLKYSSYI